MGRLLPERLEVALEGGALPFEATQGGGVLLDLLFQLAHRLTGRGELIANDLLRLCPGGELPLDPAMLGHRGAALIGRGFTLATGGDDAGLEGVPFIAGPELPGGGVGEPLGGEGEVTIQATELDAHGAETADDLG